MATLNATARGALSATARPRAGTITIQVKHDDSMVLSLSPAEARALADDLTTAAAAIDEAATSAATIRLAMAPANSEGARA